MKKVFGVFALAIFGFSVSAQTSAVTNVQPVIGVAEKQVADEPLSMKELEYNFGKIPQGKPVTHVFDVVNTGKDSLRISNVQASCGCTTPEWEHDKAVAPGGSTKITVGYNAAAEGSFNKTITIAYNGTLSKQFTIKGEVWKTPAESAPANKALEGLKN